MLLSIVIPTLNRLEYLKVTIQELIPQVERNLDDVELCVCINNSKDKSEEYINNIAKEKTFIKLKSYKTSVDISESFSRSINMCNGKYIILFGDDDLPVPYFIEFILTTLKENYNCGILHYNRLIGRDYDFNKLNKLKLENSYFLSKIEKYPLSVLIEKFNIGPGFITSMAFKKEAWNLGISVKNKNHYGYEFLSRIYLGISKLEKSDCFYYSYPIIVQRMVQHREWNDKWPKYWFIGVPELLKYFDDIKISNTAYDTWVNNLNASNKKFIYNLLWASSYKKIYKKHIKHIMSHQKNILRKAIAFFIIMFMPSFIFGLTRKILHT